MQEQEGRTEISTMGQFAIVDRLTNDFQHFNDDTIHGVGDDCAVIGTGNILTLVNTQTMAEGVHFDMTFTPLRHLGYKAAAKALSNVAAMNGTPHQLLVSLAVSNRYSVEALDEIYAGINLCCERYHVDMVGGEICSSRSGMVITTTAVGSVDKSHITYRRGAKLHDLLCVSGDLGSAYSGLLILERERVTFQADPNFKPQLKGFEYVLERFLKPEPRLDIVQLLRNNDIVPSAMIDVSDGLASDVIQLCKHGDCGCEVYEERIPIDYQTSHVCSDMNKNLLPISNALNGGEDYELLFTIHQTDYEKIKNMPEIHIIGHITEPVLGAQLVTPQNTTIEMRAPGWQGRD